MKTGNEKIAEERTRQITHEGWSAEHDATHTHGELRIAAICYEVCGDALKSGIRNFHIQSDSWPWAQQYWKPSDSIERNYVKSGALFKAEADRFRYIRDHPNAMIMDREAERMGDKIDKLQPK